MSISKGHSKKGKGLFLAPSYPHLNMLQEKRAIKKSVLKNFIAKCSCKLKKCFFTVKYNNEIEVCSIANAELSSVNMGHWVTYLKLSVQIEQDSFYVEFVLRVCSKFYDKGLSSI